MAPTPQPTMTREQQQALAKARARARISAGAGLGPVNPMEAQGQAAQREYEAAGSPQLPKSASIAPTNRFAAPEGTFVSPERAEQRMAATAGVNKANREMEEYRARRGPIINAISDTILGGLNAGDKALAAGAGKVMDVIDPQRVGPRFISENVTPFAGQNPNNDILRFIPQTAVSIAENPAVGASELVEGMEPTHMIARGGNNLRDAGNAAVRGDWEEAQAQYSEATPDLLMGTFGLTAPGSMAVTAARNRVMAPGNALRAEMGRAAESFDGAPRPAAPVAGQASVAPVAQPTVPQAPSRPAQARPAGAGQQPAAGPAVAPAGVAGGQGGGVLNATPVAVGQSPVALAKSDARIIGRLLKAGGVARNDVNNVLAGLVQAYQGSNSTRLPLAFFAEEYLPTVLPKQTADDVIQKLRGFGRERFSANNPGDSSRATMRNTVDTLRSTQQDNLSGVMDANLYKGKLIGQEDKLNAALEQNARTAYSTALENANNRLLSGRATQAERDALGEIQSLLHNDAFLKEVPAHLRIKAMRDGINLEDFVQKDPIAAAHWLQSELRQAVTAAEGVGGVATSESRLYGEMRTTLLEQLEKVVPGYRGARKAHGDIYGAKEAIEFGGNFFKSARSEVDTARLARQFKAMSTRQKTAATMSIRDALKNEFRNKAEDTAAKVTRLQQAGVLDALETVLGADGKRVADAIRNTVKENERLRAVDQLSGSPTHDNGITAAAAQEAVRSPLNTAIKKTADKSNLLYTAGIDAMLMLNGVPFPITTTGAFVGRAADKFGNPSAKKLASATKTLYDLPAPSNALAGPSKPPRVSGPRSPKPTPEQVQATLDDLLRQYDALDHRADPAAGQKLLRQIDRLKKQLGPANALSAPPAKPGPIVKNGFGGSRPLPMDEASRMGRADDWVEVVPTKLDAESRATIDDHFGEGFADIIDADQTGQQALYYAKALMDEGESAEQIATATLLEQIGSARKAGRPAEAGSSKLLAGMGASPEAIGAVGGGAAGYFGNPSDANQDGVIDEKDRGLNAVGGLISGGLLAKGARMGANALSKVGRAVEEAPLPLSKDNRIFSPGKPDDLGFITSTEYVLATPPARFKDAKTLTPEQWRKFMREGGASNEAFQFQIEPALKRLADEGYTGDIPKAKLEEALARTRGTLSKPPEKRAVERSAGSTTGRRGTTFEAPTETDYSQYVAPGSSSNYKQHVLLLPKEQGAGYKSHNWRSENPVGHIRTTNRTSANGEKVLHVEELQSDLHQEGAKYGYADDPKAQAALRANADYHAAHQRWLNWYEAQEGLQRKRYLTLVSNEPEQIADPVGRELFREAKSALERTQSFKGSGNAPPRAPMENWEEPFIRYALKQGADQGVDVITFPTSKTLHHALQNEGTGKFYDGRLPRHLESVAKSLGLRVEEIEVPIANKSAGHYRAGARGDKFNIANEKSGEWYFDGGEFDTLREAQDAASRLNKKTSVVPAIRLTPEAKARLSEGVIMDAKDPGRRAPPKPPAHKPTQASLGFGGKGPPADPPGPPRKPPVKNPPASRAEAEAREALKKARSEHTKARRRNVMLDNRDQLNKPFEDAETKAAERLERVMNNDARLKTAAARGRAIIDSPNVKDPLKLAAAIGIPLAGATVGYSLLAPKPQGPPPTSPRDPKFYWQSVSKRKDAVTQAQSALDEWGEWPKDVEFTGTPGNVTKAAIETWRYNMRQLQLDKKNLGRQIDLEVPITQDEMGMLLAGPGGHKEGKTWKTKHGEPVKVPAP